MAQPRLFELARASSFDVPNVSYNMNETKSYIKHENTIDSVLNVKKNEKFLETVDDAIGDPYVFIGYKDAKGNAINKPFYLQEVGDYVVPQGGYARVLNDKWLSAKTREAQLIEQKTLELYNSCVMSDEHAQICLDLSPADYDNILGPRGQMAGMSAEMAALDGRVGTLKGLPAGSALQTQAASKLHFVCSKRLDKFRVINTHRSTEGARTAANQPEAIEGSQNKLISGANVPQ
jgi:hypothetical protein